MTDKTLTRIADALRANIASRPRLAPDLLRALRLIDEWRARDLVRDESSDRAEEADITPDAVERAARAVHWSRCCDVVEGDWHTEPSESDRALARRTLGNAAADALTDRYAANEARQREEAGRAFAPDASPAPQDATQGAAEGEGDAVEEGEAAGPSEALLCHKCGHGIDEHRGFGCFPCGGAGVCPCLRSPSDIARHLIAQAAGAERERLAQEPDPEPVVLPEGWRLDNGHDLIRPGDCEGARVGVVARDHRSWYAMSATSAEWRVYDTKQQAVNFLRTEAERESRHLIAQATS